MKEKTLLSLLIALFCLTTVYASGGNSEKIYDIRLDNYFGGSLAVTDTDYQVRGRMAYIGSGSLNSIYLNYQVDDGEVVTTFFDNIGFNPQIPFFYEAEQPWLPSEQGSYELSLWFSGLNGEPEDVVASHTLIISVDVYDYLPERELALIESFSSINCGSCVYVSNMLKNLVQANIDKYAMIYYHPMAHENSPLFNFNPKDQTTRRDYYEVFYTPFAAVGSLFQGNGADVNQYLMDIAHEKPPGFTIDGSYFIENGMLHAEVETESFANFPDHDLRLYVVLIEDSISFDSPPGSNGEQDFYHVMRSFLPDADGILLQNQSIGSSLQIDLQYEIPMEEIDTAQIQLLAFIQDHETMSVHQLVQLDYLDPEDLELFNVTFNVTDGDGNIIDDAIISFNGEENDAGDYFFENIAAGNYAYTISRVCYASYQGQVEVEHENTAVDAVLALDIMPGDANGDGIVNLLDIILMANHWIGVEPGITCSHNADVNNDGEVNSLDIVLAVNIFLSGKPDPAGN